MARDYASTSTYEMLETSSMKFNLFLPKFQANQGRNGLMWGGLPIG